MLCLNHGLKNYSEWVGAGSKYNYSVRARRAFARLPTPPRWCAVTGTVVCCANSTRVLTRCFSGPGRVVTVCMSLLGGRCE